MHTSSPASAVAKYAPPLLPNLTLLYQGKVRDTYELPDFPDLLLMVTSDRISTHNVVHLSLIPDKGKILTALTLFWRNLFQDIPTHITATGNSIYAYLPGTREDYPTDLHQYAFIAQKLDIIPREFIFRIRLMGSLYVKEYSQGKDPYGLKLPAGLSLMHPFPEPIFTPTVKSDTDPPLLASQVCDEYPEAVTLAQLVYERGLDHALSRDIEIIDTKMEMGYDKDGNLILADEFLTPDCSRFITASRAFVGQEPDWMDKEFVRKTAESIWLLEEKKPIRFSDEICWQTTARYHLILEGLTGHSLSSLQKDLEIS